MTTKIKIVFLLLCCSIPIFSQYQKKIDSLHKLYLTHKNGNIQIAEESARKSVFFSNKSSHDSLAIISHYYLAEVLYKQRKTEEAEKNIITTLKLLESSNNDKFKALSFLSLAKINRVEGNYEISLININKALSIAENNNYFDIEHKILISKAILFRRTKNPKKSKKILKNILKNNKYRDTSLIGNTYNALGLLYSKSFRLKDSGVIFYKKGINLVKNTNNNYLKTVLYLNYGTLLLRNDNKKEGLYYLKLTEEIAKKSNNFKSLFYVNNSLAIYHHGNKDYKKAIEKYMEAIEKYGNYVKNSQKAQLHWLLSEALFLSGQYKDSYIYQEKYVYLKDSLFTEEKNKTFEKLQTEYEVEKKNSQIAFLEKEKVLEAQQKKLVYGIGGLLLFILGLLAFVFRFRMQSQKLIRKQEQQLYKQEKEQLEQNQRIKHIEGFIQGEEKEKNRIAIELHDGIGGKLAGVKHLVNALKNNENTTALAENITDITKEVRLLSHSLSYTYSLQKPLKDLLHDLQEQYKNHFTIEIVLYPETEINAISDEKKLFIYRAIQELVNNCYKYAKANHIAISLTADDTLSLLVEDNGVGFEINETTNGIGLQNIKEKLVKFNGELHIDSSLGKGTTIIIKLPK